MIPARAFQITLDPFGLTTEIFLFVRPFAVFIQLYPSCYRIVGKRRFVSSSFRERKRIFSEITDITVSPDRFSVLGNIHADYDREGDIVFDTDFTINTIPYHFNGMYSDRICRCTVTILLPSQCSSIPEEVLPGLSR